MQTVLVAGGAGYVGSHCCLRLAEAGFKPVVVDNLSNGHAAFAQWGPLEICDIADGPALDAIFQKHKPVAVLHFAALIEVGESVKIPGAFYANNVGGAISLIEAARRAGVNALVFSSTCATYGNPITPLLSEDHPQNPLNPYGRSKLMVEQVLADLDRYVGFRSACLRYFNAAGADFEGRIGERHHPETHAIPLAIRAAMTKSGAFKILGLDYPTPDGTAVRDYIHVLDLADAHVKALQHLLAGGESIQLNLGTGVGTSVKELVDTIERVSGQPMNAGTGPRREGDANVLVADNAKARRVLDWTPQYSLEDIIRSAWAWHETEGLSVQA
jgi:UDP-glucose 4-epimerase